LEQNIALFAFLFAGELTIDRGFGALISQVLPPACDLLAGRLLHVFHFHRAFSYLVRNLLAGPSLKESPRPQHRGGQIRGVALNFTEATWLLRSDDLGARTLQPPRTDPPE